MAKKKPTHIAFLNKALKEAGAEELKENYYYINGWRIKFNRAGVYWHSRMVPELGIVFSGLPIEEKSGKPFTPRTKLKREILKQFVHSVSINKTKKLIRKEAREAKSEKRTQRRRMLKRVWCNECQYSPQGVDAKKCDSMKSFQEKYGMDSCVEERWWNWNWCYNARRVYKNPKEVHIGRFDCTVIGKKCPYNKQTIVKGEFILGRKTDGEHFAQCPSYEGHRMSPGETIIENEV